jgi:hypothetical protein
MCPMRFELLGELLRGGHRSHSSVATFNPDDGRNVADVTNLRSSVSERAWAGKQAAVADGHIFPLAFVMVVRGNAREYDNTRQPMKVKLTRIYVDEQRRSQ